MLFKVPDARSSLGLPGTVNTTRLLRMLELAMATASSNQEPSVVLWHAQYVTDFHRLGISRMDALRPVLAGCRITCATVRPKAHISSAGFRIGGHGSMGSRSDTVPSNVSSGLARSDPDPTGRRLACLSLASADLSKRTRQKARPDPGRKRTVALKCSPYLTTLRGPALATSHL